MLEIPDEVIDVLRVPEQEAPKRIRQELAVRLYEKGLLAFGKAQELAGMDYWDFHDLLASEGIERHYGVRELAEDLKTLDHLS
jgi:predicted HTH domain antitoxin